MAVLDEQMEDMKTVPGFGPQLVKGLGHVMGNYDKFGDLIEPSTDVLIDASNRAEQMFRKSIRPATRGYSTEEDWARVNPTFRTPLMKLASPDAITASLMARVNELSAGIQKDISLTSPVTTGLVPFDLESPAKLQYPVGSPLRNKIPRTRGQGVAHRFKKITHITGSQQDFSSGFFINELPGGSFNSLNYPPAINLTGADGLVSYAYMGQGNNAGLLTELAGRGFEDIEALLTHTLLQSMMMQEEGAMLYARYTSALVRPGTATVTAQTPGTQTNVTVIRSDGGTGAAVLTGVSTNVYVKVTALSGMGETLASVSAGTAAPNGSQDVKVTWADVTGAVEYRVYVSTGGSDPGDSSRFLMGRTPNNYCELSGALPVSGTVAPATNTTQQTNGYDGMIADLSVNAGSVIRQNAPWSAGCPEIQVSFENEWNATRGNPDEVWMSGPDRLSFSRNYLAGSSTGPALRIAYTSDESGRLTAGQVVGSVWNEVTGKNVPLTVHPWLVQGNVLIPSYTIPYPNSSTPNVWENVMVQDYLGLAFPNIDLARRFAIIMYGALVDYAPIYNAIIQGVIFS